MAIQEIILAIDEYIAQLKMARRLLATSSDQAASSAMKTQMKTRLRASAREETVVLPSASAPVVVRVIPPKGPRQSRPRRSVISSTAPVVASSIPQGPIVVRPGDIPGKSSPILKKKRPYEDAGNDERTTDHLNELAKEVKRRLAANYK